MSTSKQHTEKYKHMNRIIKYPISLIGHSNHLNTEFSSAANSSYDKHMYPSQISTQNNI
ncbi:hypothetical protein BVRB_5g102230 [Beta vulgaris subsp. vulgaris]|nr:hypothetical protein BVRB_5g102230 [Beta vulgaris subsp. vulgaris]